MTEAEWMECTDPMQMLDFLQGRATERKLRLFGIACCRSVIQHCSNASLVEAIETAERYADGLASQAERSSSRRAVHTATQLRNQEFSWETHINDAGAWAVYWSLGRQIDVLGCCRHCDLVIGRLLQRDARLNGGDQSSAWLRGREIGTARQVLLLREVFGNPFRPITLDPSCRSSGVVALAQTIYDQRAFERMPELADALQTAGCTDAQVLAHCREPGPHVRGCWVVDVVLRRA